MCELVIMLKFTVGDMGIELRRGERCMAEELTHATYGCSGVEHVGRE